MNELGDYRWSGYPLARKQAWVHEGQGGAAVSAGTDLLAELAGTFGESRRRLASELAELGVHWSGPGASAAVASLRAVLGSAGGLAATASGTGAGLSRYGESFEQVKVRIPGTLEVSVGLGGHGDLAAVNGLQGDLRAGPAAEQHADRLANAALAAHERTTRETLAALPVPTNIPTTSSPTTNIPTTNIPTTGLITTESPATDAGATAVPTAPEGSATPVLVSASVPPNAPGTPDQGGSDGGHRHDEGATFGALPIPANPLGQPPYRTAPRQPGRLLDPTEAPISDLGPSAGTDPGGVLSPPEPSRPDDAREPRLTFRDTERRFPPEWTALSHQATPTPGQRPPHPTAPAPGQVRASTPSATAGFSPAAPTSPKPAATPPTTPKPARATGSTPSATAGFSPAAPTSPKPAATPPTRPKPARATGPAPSGPARPNPAEPTPPRPTGADPSTPTGPGPASTTPPGPTRSAPGTDPEPLTGLGARLRHPLERLHRRVNRYDQPDRQPTADHTGHPEPSEPTPRTEPDPPTAPAPSTKPAESPDPTARTKPTTPASPPSPSTGHAEPPGHPDKNAPGRTAAPRRPTRSPRPARSGPIPSAATPDYPDHDPEFDAEFDRELGLDFDLREPPAPRP